MIKKTLFPLLMIGLAVFIIPCLISGARAENPGSTLSAKPVQSGPPWFDLAWNYRRSISITNNGAALTYYQVLVKLDNSNFNFSLAKTDGSDVRFTHSDGTTELRYWIESWDSTNHKAYVWLRVPGIATGNNLIYLYYNNPDASPVSNGNVTFDGFEDDWSQFTGAGFNQAELFTKPVQDGEPDYPFTWTVLSGTPTASAGILSLLNGDGIKSSASFLYQAMGMRAKFNSGAGYEWGGFINGNSGKRTMIGDLSTDPNNLFLFDYRNNLESVLLPRVAGEDWHNNFHVYEVRWNAAQCKGDIDHGVSTATSTQPAQVPDTTLPVSLYSDTGSNASLNVDWVYVRQYRDPEPTISIGAEQGVVALSINSVDSPDPIQKLKRLTYQLTVSNSSVINAQGVVVTDTLPANVLLGPISFSQGSCVPGSVILCDLNIIYPNSTAWITINVTPTVDGEITNTASVSSLGYELDLSDNIAEAATLVDTIPPVVNWEKPVHTNENYRTRGGTVLLEASATDNDQVASVEFRLWDHLWNGGAGRWVSIGVDYTYPYQALFDSNILEPNVIYQMAVRASDRAENVSSNRIIYIERIISVLLPIMKK